LTPPELILFASHPDWNSYEDAIYAVYLETVAHAQLTFQGSPLKVRFKPESKKKGYGFWHLISEAPEQSNRNEEERIPDLRRCERVRWVAWCIHHADSQMPGFSWWENQRGRETHVVIWAELHDFAVVMAKRNTEHGPKYYLLKTAYCLNARTIRKFQKERDEWLAQKD
jgi:hypothetical protein